MDEEVHQKELDNNNSLRDLEQLRQEVKRLESQALNLDAETTSLTEQLQNLENEMMRQSHFEVCAKQNKLM